MEIKNVQQTTIYGKQVQTSLKELHQHVKTLPEKILEEIHQQQLTINGEQIWIYNGADGQAETVFDLTVAFPVKKQSNKELSLLQDFKCISTIHEGPWDKLGDTYCQVIEELNKQGLQMTEECREIYFQVDFENPLNNKTEVQIGIK